MGEYPWLVAGFGCRQGCPPAQLHSLLLHALGVIGASAEALAGIATLERRRHEPGLVWLATQVRLPMMGYDAAALAPFEPQLSHRSAASWRYTGCHGVAESAALAHCATLSGSEPRLVLTRQCSEAATVALAIAC